MKFVITIRLFGLVIVDSFTYFIRLWPNPSQIRWSAYAYITYYVVINILMFYSKNYLTRIFLILFHQNFMRSAMPKNSEKILT